MLRENVGFFSTGSMKRSTGKLQVYKCLQFLPISARYDNEIGAYQAIQDQGGSPYFATLRVGGYGPVLMSNVVSDGFVVLLSERTGIPFSDEEWVRIGESGRNVLKAKLLSAISVLRTIGVEHGDPIKANVLFDSLTEEMTVLDLEDVLLNNRNFPAEWPELRRIMRAP
jgi:hypothetical protein